MMSRSFREGFSRKGLDAVRLIAIGCDSPERLSSELEISRSQAYRVIKGLLEKDIISNVRGRPEIRKNPLASLLAKVLPENPKLSGVLYGKGTVLLSCLIDARNVSDLEKASGIGKVYIYKILSKFRKFSIVTEEKGGYVLNSSLWPDLSELAKVLDYNTRYTDARVPSGSDIYYKTNDEILFSSRKEIDASPAAFSEFDKFGINILGEKNYYYLPKIPEESMNKKKVFLDSLMICEKEGGVRNILFVALFYLKYRNDLKDAISPVLENIKAVIEGKRIRGYPSVDEIKEKAEVYDIKI